MDLAHYQTPKDSINVHMFHFCSIDGIGSEFVVHGALLDVDELITHPIIKDLKTCIYHC